LNSDDIINKSLHHSVKDGCAHAGMLGLGEAYLGPFAIFLQMGNMVIGLLASVPLFLGALAQLFAVYLLDRFPSRRRLVIIPALTQALVWLPLFILPVMFPQFDVLFLLSLALLHYALASLIAPAWNSWMGDLVSPSQRGGYFGRRDRYRTFCQLVGILMGGLILYEAKRHNLEVWGFGIIFGLAFILRLISVYHLHKMAEPKYLAPAHHEIFSLFEFIGGFRNSNFGRFTVFMAVMLCAINLGSPFFVVYMLRDLQFSYLQFTGATTVVILAQALTFHNWGRLGDSLGNRRLLMMASFALPIIPLLWLFSTNFIWIFTVQAFSGVVWAGFNLSAANFIFDAVSPPKRARCVAYYNVLTNGGILIGASVGGFLSLYLPANIAFGNWHISLVSNLYWLFLLSGLLRIGVIFYFWSKIKEVREVDHATHWDIIFQVVGLFPLSGWRISIFNGTHPTEKDVD
jgi:MFS family permease